MTLSPKGLLKQDGFWAFLFVLGAILLNWPVLALAQGRSTAFGFPFVLVYVTAIWLLIIVLAYIFDRSYSE